MANLMTIYENFKKALLRLEEVLNLPKKNEIIRDSAIQRFEFTLFQKTCLAPGKGIIVPRTAHT